MRSKYEVYRSRTEIIRQMLEVADDRSGGVTKTKLMYKVFLGYDQLKEYLNILIGSELLRYDVTNHKFRTTEKGLTFLQVYNEIDQMLKEHDI